MKEQIITIHQSMEKLTLEAGVSEKKFRSVIIDLEEFIEPELEALLLWLTMVQQNQFKNLKWVKGLQSDEKWERYKAFGVTGLHEQKLLKDAQREVRKVWEQPYRTAKQQARIKNRKAINKHKEIK